MKAKELIERLHQLDPEAEIWLPATNKQGIPTYALLDFVLDVKYASIYGDIFNNPGDIDRRLLKQGHDEDSVVLLSSLFEYRETKN
ncbi:MAG: hypothetical protein K2K98_02870 [Muribaculaceae bacterium]|nr:hypothetical protein [Muribaculaceae bacterium]